jgi:hypothetical protein
VLYRRSPDFSTWTTRRLGYETPGAVRSPADRVSASKESHGHANLKFIMKPAKFKKMPLLYGASFLLDIFGSDLVVHRRTLNVESDDGGSIDIGFRALGADFAKVMPKEQPG